MDQSTRYDALLWKRPDLSHFLINSKTVLLDGRLARRRLSSEAQFDGHPKLELDFWASHETLCQRE